MEFDENVVETLLQNLN